ncbi:MAG: FimV/HubP family polar landmark protein [Gammaproteobacteria bacterium]
MSQRLSFLLVGTLISWTVLGAGLDLVRVGRYSALVPGPSPEQTDPFALPIHTEFSYSAQTVGHALKQVLARSGYRLASLDASCPSLPVLLDWPLPAVHRTLGPMRLDEALKTLAGPAHYLVVDPVHRLVSFELREPYQGLVQTRAAGAALSSHTAQVPTLLTMDPEPVAFGANATHRIGPIPPGTELWPIAAKLRKVFRATTEQVMVGLFETNPESFCYQNLHCLKARAYLDPPTKARVVAMEPAAAHRTVQRQFKIWRHRTRLPVPGRQTDRSPPLAERTADSTTENAEGARATGMLPAIAGMRASQAIP